MSRGLGYQRDLRPANFKQVRIGDSLSRIWGRTQRMVPVERDVQEQVLDGSVYQGPPLGFKPSGIRDKFVNHALEDWFSMSQVGTGYYGDLTTTDPLDDKYAMIYRLCKEQMVDPTDTFPTVMVPGQGLVMLDAEYWAYAKRKMDLEQEVAFKSWMFGQMDLSEPAQREWWVQHVPEFKKQLQSGKKYSMKILNRIANIRINGIQSEDDLKFLYQISIGAYDPVSKGEKIIPPSNTIESDNFPGVATPMDAQFPGVHGPKRNVLPPGARLDVFPSKSGNWDTRNFQHVPAPARPVRGQVRFSNNDSWVEPALDEDE